LRNCLGWNHVDLGAFWREIHKAVERVLGHEVSFLTLRSHPFALVVFVFT
jgi:hypothetical protein